MAMLLAPAVYVLAIWMAFFILGDENIKWWGDLIVLLMVLGPPLAGFALGIRSARSGNPMGAHASALAGAWTAFMGMFWYAANFPYNGESGVMPVVLGVITAAVAALAVELWYRLRGRHPGTA